MPTSSDMAASSPSKPIEKAARTLRAFVRDKPSLALILGSGFIPVMRDFHIEREVGYDEIPGFPALNVPGHPGRLVLARVGETPVLILGGRAHFYEGHSMADITFPVRVLSHLGVRHLLLTNAAGGLNPKFRPGDLMVVTDHINFMGENPLRGRPREEGDPFVELSSLYDTWLRKCLNQAARRTSATLRQGIYLAVSGSSYETPAEIRVFRKWGADAVGMSTVPEAIVARHCGMRVAALSCITNAAAGLSHHPPSHEEVLAVGRRSCRQASRLIRQFIQEYAKDLPSNTGGRRH
jgi:purine-nucleoside phosphorylase